jgi:hypothetical protein
MPATYEPIATTTLGSAAASITFSSIPATYTDLRLILANTMVNAGTQPIIRFNGDTGTNYSQTFLRGNGSTAFSGRSSGIASIAINDANPAAGAGVPQMSCTDVFSYAGSTYKTCLVQSSNDKNGSGTTQSLVGLWRDTSAINQITISEASSNNFDTGTTATLYGIKNA